IKKSDTIDLIPCKDNVINLFDKFEKSKFNKIFLDDLSKRNKPIHTTVVTRNVTKESEYSGLVSPDCRKTHASFWVDNNNLTPKSVRTNHTTLSNIKNVESLPKLLGDEEIDIFSDGD